MSELRNFVGRLAEGETLSFDDSAAAFDEIASGKATPAQIGAFLMALRLRGETVEEIAGAATAMRSRMLTVHAPPGAVDIVGTGGDSSGSYNISTGAAFVVAGAGVPVAKHGNRAISSCCGAADVLSALGVDISLRPAGVSRCINEAGIGFMFAPTHHPALKEVATARVELGTRTIFNMLGPLLNPAGVEHHMIGVYSAPWTIVFARVLDQLGSKRAFIVCGSDGLDEITTTGPTTITELDRGSIRTFEVEPESVGLPRVATQMLIGGDARINATALRDVLGGSHCPYRDAVLINAAAALVVVGQADSLRDGVNLATTIVDSGAAQERLENLVRVSNAAALADCGV